MRSSMHRQVLLLASAQALFQTASSMVMTVGALAAGQIARPGLATVPIASMFLGTVLMIFPASMWMARKGRRNGFLLGSVVGVAGGAVAAWGIQSKSLLILSVGTWLIGAYSGFAQFYRFAASEIATEDFRSRAISWVMAGGIVAAFLGPGLGMLGAKLLAPEYTGSFLILAAGCMVSAGLLLPLKDAKVAATPGPQRPLREIVGQPNYLVALFGAATGSGVMVLAMTATPLAMAHHQHTLSMSATVIQAHLLGMFVPSFFTGTLVARFGVPRIMLTGILLMAIHVAISVSGTGMGSFVSALVLLGVGWNFLFVGGTTLLTSAYLPAERAKAQATNDVVVYLTGLTASLGAAALLEVAGWERLNLLLLPWLLLALVAVGWLHRAQSARTSNAEAQRPVG
jgi:MFS family permease